MTDYTYFKNAMTDALREIQDHPEDHIQSIVNEKLKEWEVPERCNSDFTFDHKDI
jgi:hypothetical protein